MTDDGVDLASFLAECFSKFSIAELNGRVKNSDIF